MLIILFLFRNSTEWLKKNYTIDNGLPGFFRLGKYGPGCRDTAETDYKATIVKLLSSSDEGVRQWSVNMIQTDYEVRRTALLHSLFSS